MPAFNAAKTIRASIESVVNQTYKDWELIVIDDYSADNTTELVKSIDDSRIRLIINEQNLGTSSTRNIGIIEAISDWIAFLDSDDIWHKDKLEKHLHFIIKTNADISYTGTSYMNKSGQISKYNLPAVQEFNYKNLLRRNIMSCSSVIVRRELMKTALFEKGFIHEDYVAWLKILRKVEYAYGLNEPLLIYRLSANSKSSGRIHSAIQTYGAYRAVGYNKIYSFCLTLRYSLHSISKRCRIKRGFI